jgi:two-component system, cell cycle sensor histidine kinase and response regulator CckA
MAETPTESADRFGLSSQGDKDISLYRMLLDQAEDSIEIIEAATGRFIDCSNFSYSSLGYTRQEFLALSVPDIDPIVTAQVFAQFIAQIRTNGPRTIETAHRRKDGSTFPVEVKARLIQLDREYLLAIVRDITERKRTEQHEKRRVRQLELYQAAMRQLAQNQAFYGGRMEESLPAVTECAGLSLGVERASVWLFDDTSSSLILKDLYQTTLQRHSCGITLRKNSFPKYFHALETQTQAIDAGDAKMDPRTSEFAEPYLIPLNIGAMLDAPIWKDGRLVGVLCLEHTGGTRIWTEEEQVFAASLGSMATIALAVEERRQAQERTEELVRERTHELQEAHRTLQQTTIRLHTILAQSPLAIIEVDEAGCVTRWNEAATQTFGWTEAEALGRQLPYLSENEIEQANGLQASLLQGERLQNVDLRRRKKDGTPVDLSFSGVGILDHDGNSRFAVGFLIDISERKRLEEQYRQAQKMEAVGQLAGGVAHDFNNLLTVIIGQSTLLLNQLPTDDPRQTMVQDTLQAAERAAELSTQMLVFSRRQVFTQQPLALNTSIMSIKPILGSLISERIGVVTDLAPDLWTILCDKTQFDQVLMNLAINARDAMPNGGTVTIATRNCIVSAERSPTHRFLPAGDYVQVTIRDTGVGMSRETLAHIFEPFFTTKEVGKGTGLGLATVYGVVKQSLGYIFVESELGRGATFDLYFPRMRVTAPQERTPVVRPTRGSESVLVVEDQDAVRNLVVLALRQNGYQVSATANGEEALRLAKTLSEPFQALVSDVIMPAMTGVELAAELRCLWPHLRVLFMSGYTDSGETIMLNYPNSAYLQKPFKPDELAKQLRDLLDRDAKKAEGV